MAIPAHKKRFKNTEEHSASGESSGRLNAVERVRGFEVVPFPSMSSEARAPDPSQLSLGSPESPVSQRALRLPECHHRDRSPSPRRGYLIPSPFPTRRSRAGSVTARASQGPVFTGVCKCFSRSKGHGFISPSEGGSDIFVHISDIEGEYVPMEGDEVSYKVCSIPPKHVKVQAVEVTITHLAPGSKHETWTGAAFSS